MSLVVRSVAGDSAKLCPYLIYLLTGTYVGALSYHLKVVKSYKVISVLLKRKFRSFFSRPVDT